MSAEVRQRFKEQPLVVAAVFMVVAFGLLYLVARRLEPLVVAAWPTPVRGAADVLALLATPQSAFMFETMLAGMLGAYVRELLRIAYDGSTLPVTGYAWYFGVSVLLGGFSGVFVGVLLPLVVFGTFEHASQGTWTLVAAGAASGYVASGSMLRQGNAFTRLLKGIATLESTQIASEVQLGVRQALAAPKPVNYTGTFVVDVLQGSESVVRRGESGSLIAAVERGVSYRVRATFFAAGSSAPKGGSPARTSIDIRNGDDAPDAAPFRLFVNFGFSEIDSQERHLTVSRTAHTSCEDLEFTVPFDPPSMSVDGAVPDARLDLSLSVYQKARYFDTVVLALVIQTDSGLATP